MDTQAYQIQRDVRVLVARPTRNECVGADVALLVAELCDRIDSAEADSVVIELCNVQHMDSACISKLLLLRAKAKSAGGSVALSRCHANVEFLFQMTKLDKVFGLFTTTESAVTELRERRGRCDDGHNLSLQNPDGTTPPRRRRYTPLLNALINAHRRKLAHSDPAGPRTGTHG